MTSISDHRRTVLRAARALVGDRAEIVEDAVLVIESGRVVAAGRATDVDLESDADLIDIDACLLPGFVDAHVHIGLSSPGDVLRGGVTTVRDLGWPTEAIFALVDAARADEFDGPRILAAGPMLTAPGGYPARAAWAPPGTAIEIADEDEARAAVASLAARRAAIIKVALNAEVGPTFDEGVLRAIVDGARAEGLGVTAHIYGLEELQKAVAAGITELAHMLMSAEHIPPPLVEDMVSRGIAVVPTLAIHDDAMMPTALANVTAFLRAGGVVLYGTDLGNEGPRPGIDAREVAALSACGMSSLDIVRAATVAPREHIGIEAGAFTPGAPADVIAVPLEALTSAAALTDVRLVMKGGRVVRRSL